MNYTDAEVHLMLALGSARQSPHGSEDPGKYWGSTMGYWQAMLDPQCCKLVWLDSLEQLERCGSVSKDDAIELRQLYNVVLDERDAKKKK